MLLPAELVQKEVAPRHARHLVHNLKEYLYYYSCFDPCLIYTRARPSPQVARASATARAAEQRASAATATQSARSSTSGEEGTQLGGRVEMARAARRGDEGGSGRVALFRGRPDGVRAAEAPDRAAGERMRF